MVYGCCTDAPFEVCVEYAGGITSITINKASIEKDFTPREVAQEQSSTEEIEVGVFIVTVTTQSLEAFDVIAFSTSQYVAGNNTFQALADDAALIPMKLSFIGNKNPAGTITNTEFFDNDIVITHPLGSTTSVMTFEVTSYMDGGQVEYFEGTTSSMPMFFEIVGL